MPTIAEVRQQYPQYSDMSDSALANALHSKFYSDIPKAEFEKKVGVAPVEPSQSEPTTSQAARIAIDFENQRKAASQGTTPNTSVYKNLISAEVHENDAGEVMYRDPATGKVVPTDQSKQVVLTDPTDNKIKIYARSDNTNEGMASSAGRLLQTGLATGAPTARVSEVAPAVQAARELKPGQQVVAAANRLSETGLPVEVPKAVATDNMAIQRAASVARNVPLAGDPLVKAAERTVSQLGDKASEVAAGFGGGTVVGSGEAARDSIKGYITGKSAAESNKFYKRVDDLIDPAVTTDLRATRDAAESILARRANAAISDQSGAVKRIEEAITKPGGLNYEGVKDLRGYVRELKDNPSLLPADISGKELNSVYDALSKDLKSAVHNAGGPEASVAFDRANRHYALLSDRREALAKIIGTSGDAPAERVFDRMVSMASSKSTADISKLAQARKAMGADDWNEFASGIIGKMGRDTANFSGPEKLQASGFSPQRFLTAYGNLSPAGKTLLFRSGGKSELANHLDDIARVSGRFKELQKFSNPSGTGQMAIGGGMGAAFMAEPLTTVTSVLGGRIVASALAKPASAASVAKLAKAQQALIINPSQSKVAAYSLAARNLINTVGAKNISPNDFLKALQAPAASRADEQQPDVPRPPGQ